MTRRLATTVCVALFLLVNALFAAAAGTAQETARGPAVKIDVASMQPRIVNDRTDRLEVAFSVTNVSDAPITDVRARLQLGAPQATADEMRQTLAGQENTEGWTPFESARQPLQPGERTEWTLRADLRTAQLNAGSVYPLLVNVNGTPEGGAEARLGEVHLTLPVLSTPGGGKPAKPDKAQPVSMLWPIADRPRVVSAPLSDDDTLVLADDDLATAMREGGRLHDLVAAAQGVRTNKRLFESLCFAIDPELVTTARLMSDGYRVRTEPKKSVPGEGAEDAKRWLAALRKLVAGHCVVTLPYGGADVSSLAQSAPSLAESAAGRDGDIAKPLDVQPQDSVSYAPSAVTSEGAKAYAEAGKTVLLTDSGTLQDRTSPAALNRTDDDKSSGQRVVPYDQLTARALAPNAPKTATTTSLDASVAAAHPNVATQNAIASLLFHTADDTRIHSDTLLVAPSTAWRATHEELTLLLDTLDDFAADKRVRLEPAGDTLQTSPNGSVTAADGTALAANIPPDVVEDMTGLNRTLTELTKAMSTSRGAQVAPEQVVSGVRDALITTASTAWADDPAAKRRRADQAKDQYEELVNSVRVAAPGRTINLGSESASIPVSIKNGLPVDITVSVRFSGAPGLEVGNVPDTKVAAKASQTLQVPNRALRAGRFNVDVGLVTSNGLDLAHPTKFQLESTEYGVFTVIVTATAAGALLLLSGRRIYRRLRSGPEHED